MVPVKSGDRQLNENQLVNPFGIPIAPLPAKNTDMLPDAKIPLLIACQIPALRNGMEKNGAITTAISAFSVHTRQLIRLGRIQEVKKCFSVAGVLYRNGSNLLRSAIEGVFIYAVSPFLDSQNIKELLPASLRQVRNRHLQTIN